MTRRALFMFLLFGAAFAAACELRAQQQPATRFAVVDVYVDSAEPLAAWQFELTERGGRMQVVGIEGGETRASASRRSTIAAPSSAARPIESSSPISA